MLPSLETKRVITKAHNNESDKEKWHKPDERLYHLA